MTDLVRVLIVDDSAYVRKVIRQMLSRSPFIEIVGAARDGREALEMAAELKPDVITCDLIMPELDGVGFIRERYIHDDGGLFTGAPTHQFCKRPFGAPLRILAQQLLENSNSTNFRLT